MTLFYSLFLPPSSSSTILLTFSLKEIEFWKYWSIVLKASIMKGFQSHPPQTSISISLPFVFFFFFPSELDSPQHCIITYSSYTFIIHCQFDWYWNILSSLFLFSLLWSLHFLKEIEFLFHHSNAAIKQNSLLVVWCDNVITTVKL